MYTHVSYNMCIYYAYGFLGAPCLQSLLLNSAKYGQSYIHLHVGRGDDIVGNPHRAQISQFELFVFILSLNSTTSSLSSNARQTCLSQQYPPPPLNMILASLPYRRFARILLRPLWYSVVLGRDKANSYLC